MLQTSPPELPKQNPVENPAENSVEPGLSREVQVLLSAIQKGERVISIPFVVSILIMTFQRSLGGLCAVGPGKWPMGKVITATLITSIFGWWGIPFGPIFSIVSLYHLWFGGRNQTFAVLKSAVGPIEAKRILASVPKPKPTPGIWIVRAIILFQISLVVSFVVAVFRA